MVFSTLGDPFHMFPQTQIVFAWIFVEKNRVTGISVFLKIDITSRIITTSRIDIRVTSILYRMSSQPLLEESYREPSHHAVHSD